MSEHSPEPWAVKETIKGEECFVGVDANGKWLESDPYDGVSEENWRRIVACVNACKGIPTEWLEKYGRSAVVRSIHLVPADLVGGVHEVLKGAIRKSEDVVRIDTCEHCGGIKPITEAENE